MTSLTVIESYLLLHFCVGKEVHEGISILLLNVLPVHLLPCTELGLRHILAVVYPLGQGLHGATYIPP